MEMPQCLTDIVQWITVSGPKWLLTSGLRIVLIAAGAYVVYRIIGIAVTRMERLVKDEDDSSLSEREKRARTLGNILRKVSGIGMLTVAVLMILRELGVDIAPIITAAGIGGLAIGFGAQNLVRDVISGFFMLMENQIRVGDVVRINGTGGLVEDINLRTTVLRDLEGTVHVFPNGSITSVSNMTKEWSRAVIDVGVAYKEDVDYVIDVLKQIGEELLNDREYGPLIVEAPEVLGLDSFGDSAVVIKTMITTKPLKQWAVGREFRRRVKKKFDELGIEIPFPHTTVYWGEASKPFSVLLKSQSSPLTDEAVAKPLFAEEAKER